MKNFALSLTTILLILNTSCLKDEIYSESVIENSPPIKKNPIEVSGIVKNQDGKTVSSASVKFFQNGKLVGETLTDINGAYNADKIPLNPDLEITIEYKKQDFDFKYRRINPDVNKALSLNVILGKYESNNEIQISSKELLNPTDTNLIRIFGHVKLMNGTPIKGVKCLAVWAYTKYSSNIWAIDESSTDFSDESGYFEILVPKNKTLHLSMKYLRYPKNIFAQCPVQFQILNNPSNDLPSGSSFNNIGELSSDHQVITRNDVEFETIFTTLRGRALRCDGSPVRKGILMGGITIFNTFPVAFNVDSNYVFGPNGEFEIYIETCENDQYQDIGSVIQIQDTEATLRGSQNINSISNETNIGEILLCEDLKDYYDKLELKLGSSDLKQYLNGGDNPSSGKFNIRSSFNVHDGTLGEDIFLIFENYSIGIVPITRLEMWKSRKKTNDIWEVYETTFEATPNDVVLTITKIEPPYVYGNVSGTVVTPQGVKSIHIDFEIYDK